MFVFAFLCSGPKPATSGGPPPPPPPPPPGLFSDAKAEAKSETKAINALFADINKGEDVTRGKAFYVNHILGYISYFLLCIAMVSQRPLIPFLRTSIREMTLLEVRLFV
jgi:hypothetical protein